MSRIRVKVCGITCFEDAMAAIDAGADSLGFNFWPGSKRYIDPTDAAEWIGALPAFVSRVAVLVNPDLEEALQIAAKSRVHILQLHGQESPEFCHDLIRRGVSVIKAFAAVAEMNPPPIDFGTGDILIDTARVGSFGGTGELLDLQAARSLIKAWPQLRITVAGGLTCQNVAQVAGALSPYAVDVASGVEEPGNPRRKQKDKLLCFINAVRAV